MKGRMTNAPPIGDRLLTLREAADVLRLSALVRKWPGDQSPALQPLIKPLEPLGTALT
jgi:hypothetical protein